MGVKQRRRCQKVQNVSGERGHKLKIVSKILKIVSKREKKISRVRMVQIQGKIVPREGLTSSGRLETRMTGEMPIMA